MQSLDHPCRVVSWRLLLTSAASLSSGSSSSSTTTSSLSSSSTSPSTTSTCQIKDAYSNSIDEFVEQCKEEHQCYQRLCEKYILTPEKMQEMKEANPQECNPLMAGRDSGKDWSLFVDNQANIDMIEKDIGRTNMETRFFQRKETQEKLIRILTVWCGVDPTTNCYRQGMNELLAVIVMALRADELVPLEDDYPLELVHLIDPDQLEADAFVIFSHLMRKVAGWYSGAADEKSHLGQSIKRVHSTFLPAIDEDLAQQLGPERAQVLPQLYLLPWIRLLFTRVFTTAQALKIWDCILSTLHVDSVEYVCLAMLELIRSRLLSEDPQVEVLQTLMHYPSISDLELPRLLALTEIIQYGLQGVYAMHSGAENKESLASNSQQQQQQQQHIDINELGGISLHVHDLFPSASSGSSLTNDYGHINNPLWPTVTSPTCMCGKLVKLGGGTTAFGRQSFKLRWFVLKDRFLSYYSNEHSTTPLKNASIDLRDRTVWVHDYSCCEFHLGPRNKSSSTPAASSRTNSVVELNDGDQSDSSIASDSRKFDSRTYCFYACSPGAMTMWVGALKRAINLQELLKSSASRCSGHW